jgi:hypothetical protein
MVKMDAQTHSDEYKRPCPQCGQPLEQSAKVDWCENPDCGYIEGYP